MPPSNFSSNTRHRDARGREFKSRAFPLFHQSRVYFIKVVIRLTDLPRGAALLILRWVKRDERGKTNVLFETTRISSKILSSELKHFWLRFPPLVMRSLA